MVGNHKERGAWRATVHRVAQSQTRLKQLGTHQQVHSSHFESPGAGTHLTRHFGVLPLKLSAVSPQDLQDYSSQGGDSGSFEQPSAQPSRGIFCAAAAACCGESGFPSFSFSLSLVLVLPGLCCAIFAKSLLLFRI